MTGRPGAGIREIGLGPTAFMPPGGRRTAQDEVRASVVARKRSNARGAKGTQEGGKMKARTTEDKPTRVPERASQWWNQPSASGLVGTERLTGIFGKFANIALPLARDTTDRKAGCGRSARPVWREGERTTTLPTPIPQPANQTSNSLNRCPARRYLAVTIQL